MGKKERDNLIKAMHQSNTELTQIVADIRQAAKEEGSDIRTAIGIMYVDIAKSLSNGSVSISIMDGFCRDVTRSWLKGRLAEESLALEDEE